MNINYSLFFYLSRYLLLISSTIIFSFPKSEIDDQSYFDCPCPHIIAHQGASIDQPPNTIKAFQLALDQGADILELDVWRSKDGIWVVIHDKNLLRITGLDRNIDDLYFDQIKLLDAAFNFQDSSGNYVFRNKGYRIPSLEKIFKVFNEQKLNIEIKGSSKYGIKDLIQLVKDNNLESRVLVASKSCNIIKEFRKLSNNQIPTSACKEDIIKTIYLSRLPWFKYSFKAFQLPYYSEKIRNLGFTDPIWINKMHDERLVVHYWTVDNEEDMEEIVSIGSDGIITNRPKLAFDVLRRLGKR